MSQLAGGDREAFEVLYDRYFFRLRQFGTNMLNDEAVAEDLVQESFLVLIHHPEKYHAKYRFSTWIFTILANKCKNHLRNDSRRFQINQQLQPDPVLDSEFDQLNRKQVIQQLKAWLVKQSEKDQALFHLRFEQQMTIEEIAEILDIPKGSVKSGLYYLIRKIQKPFKAFAHELRNE